MESTGGLRPARTSVLLVGILLVWAIIYLPGLFRPALLDDADSVHAEAAREILERNDWVTLHVNGLRYLEKAPFMYWCIAGSFRLFGVSEWSARLPLSLGVLALLLATFSLGRRFGNARAGFYAALILATAFGTYIFTRILIPDVLVALWLTLGLDFFLRGVHQEHPSRAACWGLAAAAALGVLNKGLIGLAFPAVIAGIFLILTGRLRHVVRMRLLSSAALFLAIAAPWHILAGLRNPGQGAAKGFFWFYFVNEHFLRYLNQRVPRDYDTVPLLVFWALLLLWLLPWSVFLGPALAQIPRRPRAFRADQDGPDRFALFLGIWGGVILLFFTFSTRQEYYTVPALPALALLAGVWLARESEAPVQSALCRRGRQCSALLFAIGAAAFVTTLLLVSASAPVPPEADIADLLTRNPDKYALSLGHFFDLTPEALGAFHLPLLGTGAALLIGTGLSWLLRRRGAAAGGNLALAAMMVGVLFCSHRALLVFEPVLSSRDLARAIEKEYRPGEIIAIHGEYEGGSTLNFYTRRQVHILNGRRANLWYGSLFPDAPGIFHDDVSMAQLWEGPQRVYLWTEEHRRAEALRRIPAERVYPLARSGGKLVLSNRPPVWQGE
ncbi:MAG: glycosyltransferase family 39 protein [Acidobacteria bacterium]|nr:glycosyltransferase family 39 protein [Acidobacteriota bacterium]